MRHATTCKFCNKPITITVDEDYAKLGDPFKLIKLAACNECADIRVLRRHLEHKVAFACDALIRAGKLDESDEKRHREGLKAITQEYAKLISRWHHRYGMLWDEAVVNQIMEHPRTWGEALSMMWKMYQQWERDQESELKL